MIEVAAPDDPRIALYRGVSDPELLRREGRFVAEGRLVVRRLLSSSRFEVESILVTPAACENLRDVLEAAARRVPVYLATRQTLVEVAGFNLHRGCLAIGRRRTEAQPALEQLLPPLGEPALLGVIESLANADNVGGIFRCAHAFGAAAVVLDPDSCDPLYRKAIRTSMGASLLVPFARARHWPDDLEAVRAAGFSIVALTPDPAATDIIDFTLAEAGRGPLGSRAGSGKTLARRVALMVGNEGRGLSEAALNLADATVRIPMVSGSDSLNAATAAGIALHLYSRYCGVS